MEKFDPGLEQRVWQRMTGGPQIHQADLRPLLLDAWTQGAVYKALTGRLTGTNRDRSRKLYEKTLGTVAVLKGILALRGDPALPLQPQPVPQEPARRLLEKSYHRSLRRMTDYMARTLDPEFGVLWQSLADRERECCTILAELLGTMEK